LWVLYIGALAEQTNKGSRVGAGQSWFNAQFAQQARLMGLFF
jgi:hypothetical protein